MKSQVLLVNKQNNVLMAGKTTVSLADDTMDAKWQSCR